MSNSQSKDFLERIIPEVRSGGARNIVDLAKALKMPVETTRYKIKGILKRGLSIHAFIDYNKFGLSSYQARFHLASRAKESERKFFQFLSDSCYLTSAARRVTTNEFCCTFSVPKTDGYSVQRLLRGLAEEKFVVSPIVSHVTWKKAHMMQPEFFNLKKGVWQIDWPKLRKESSQKSDEKEVRTSEFDELDLKIASELETDAMVRLSDIASSLRTTLNNIFYHFHKHIIDGKLIDEFVIKWVGTTKQETMLVQFEFDSLSYNEERTTRAALRKLPFLWNDAFSKDTGYYVAEAMVPSSHYLETLNFLASTLGETSRKLRVLLLDPKTRLQFSLPVQLFGEKDWAFDPDARVEQLSSKLK